MSASIDSNSAAARDQLSQVPTWFKNWEGRLSRFDPASELSQLNEGGDGWRRVSDLLYTHLELARKAADYSDGLFDPTMLAVLEGLGYDRSFDMLAPDLMGTVKPEPVPAAGWSLLELDPAENRVRLAPGIRLDLGGISKAVAAEQAVARLAAIAPALVEAGGDVAISGPRGDGQPWPIAVGSPWQPERDLGWLWLSEGVVATSGRDFRRWSVQEVDLHHLIDPRTGLSADSSVVAATVVGPTSWQAESGAKAALILGPDEGLAWLERKEELEGLLLLETKQIVATEGIVDYGWQS